MTKVYSLVGAGGAAVFASNKLERISETIRNFFYHTITQKLRIPSESATLSFGAGLLLTFVSF